MTWSLNLSGHTAEGTDFNEPERAALVALFQGFVAAMRARGHTVLGQLHPPGGNSVDANAPTVSGAPGGPSVAP